jgi:PAS domain S-box-containing protein
MILLLCLLVYVLAHSRANLAETVREQTEALRDELAARQQAQEQLRQNYALLEAVSEGTSDAVFAKDRRGRYQMINSAGAGFLGTTPEAIIGRNDLELFSAETGGPIMAQDRQVMESGQVRTFEDRATAAGITRTYQATKAPWRDKSGNIIGVVGVSRDITEGKRIEEALRKSESQLTLILNNVSDIIFAVAVEAGGDFRFTSANRRFLEATGLQEHQVVGALVRDVIPAPAQEVVFRKYHEAIQSGLPVRWEEASEYPAGRKVGHVTVVPVFDSHGTCTQLVGMVHDITERLQAEDEVRRLNEDLRRHAEILEQRVAERTAELAVARDRAETADRLKSAFLATMSHELRTPLNSIIGFTGILLQGLAGPLNPEQGKQLEMVRGSARHLLALINDVLDISKIEAGQLAVNRERVQLRASIDKVAGIVKPLAEKKGLDLRVELAPEIGTVMSDTRRIEQVLLNLLNNAVKFTERGEVTLRVWAEAERTGQAEKLASGVAADRPVTATGTVVRFQVSDTGIGVKPEELATLFQPFRQIDTGLTRQHEGTGLGLVICRRLAELMGGAISVQSEWGKGSVFTFTLPASGER